MQLKKKPQTRNTWIKSGIFKLYSIYMHARKSDQNDKEISAEQGGRNTRLQEFWQLMEH